jgi:hypothetical protein
MFTMRNVFLVAVSTIFLIPNFSGAKEVAGDIVSVRGTVFIRQDGATGRRPASPPVAKPGEYVHAGDVINTSSDGAVKILMKDKTIVDIGPSTLFKLDEYLQRNGANRKAKINLSFGKLRVAVSKKLQGDGKFEVKTKNATMGVRGTEFIVKEDIPDRLSKNDQSASSNAAPAQKTEITVVQGKVDVNTAPSGSSGRDPASAATPKTVSLTAGTQLTTGAGVPAGGAGGASNGPVKVSETQMKSLTTETRIADNTFAKAVTIEPQKEGAKEETKKSDEGKVADNKAPENKAPENKKEESKAEEGKVAESKPEGKLEGKGDSSGEKKQEALAKGEGKSSTGENRAENRGENRTPASTGSGSPAPSMTAITPMINVVLPPVVVAPPPIIDVPGAPVTPFQNNGFKTNMKRVQVTIVRGE